MICARTHIISPLLFLCICFLATSHSLLARGTQPTPVKDALEKLHKIGDWVKTSETSVKMAEEITDPQQAVIILQSNFDGFNSYRIPPPESAEYEDFIQAASLAKKLVKMLAPSKRLADLRKDDVITRPALIPKITPDGLAASATSSPTPSLNQDLTSVAMAAKSTTPVTSNANQTSAPNSSSAAQPSATPSASLSPSPAKKPAAAPPDSKIADQSNNRWNLIDQRLKVIQQENDDLRAQLSTEQNAFEEIRTELPEKTSRIVDSRIAQLQRDMATTITVGAITAVVLLALTVFAAFKKPSGPSRVLESRFADHASQLRNLTQETERRALEIRKQADSLAAVGAASVSIDALKELEEKLEKRTAGITGATINLRSDVSSLRDTLRLPDSDKVRFSIQLKELAERWNKPVADLKATMSRIDERLGIEGFRKLLRNPGDWTALQQRLSELSDRVSHISTLSQNFPVQLFRWDRVRYDNALQGLSGIDKEVNSLRHSVAQTLRSLLPAYRTVAMRDPLPAALIFARDFDGFDLDGSPITLISECDGRGVSADPTDAAANWHIRGTKRAGNRTVLFPLCMEAGGKLYPGVITYEE